MGSKLTAILRWVLFLPAGILGGWLAYMLVVLLNRLTFLIHGFDPDSFLSKVLILGIGHAVLGAATVWCAARIAPARHNHVALVVAGLALVGSGFLLFPALVQRDYWAVLGALAVCIGAGGVAYSIYTGETDLGVNRAVFGA